MNWCISVHWKQLPRRRQEEGETGGEGGRREALGEREREWGAEGGSTGSGGEVARKMRGQRQRLRRLECAPAAGWLSPVGWPRIYSLVTLKGSAQGGVPVGEAVARASR